MAELIITDEEREAASYLDWDDASIGRGVKKIALSIGDAKGEDAIAWYAGALMLITRAIDSNAAHLTLNVEKLTSGDKNLGNWKVAAVRTDRESET